MASNLKPNIILFGIDSLLADHMSCYGYDRLTSPYLDRFASQGVLFENTYSAHIPTTSAYASMLTGLDVFSTQVVALRHQGPLRPEVKTLAEILRDEGYHTVCVGFDGNPSSRGFDEYLSYPAWGSWEEGRLPKAQLLNEQVLPALDRLLAADKPFFLFLRHMDPHAPYLPPEPFERMFYSRRRAATRPTAPWTRSCRVQALLRLLSSRLDAAGDHRRRLRHRPVRRRRGLHGRGDTVGSSPALDEPSACFDDTLVVHQRRPRRDPLRARVLVRPPRPLRRTPCTCRFDPAPPRTNCPGDKRVGGYNPPPGPGADDPATSWPKWAA